MPMPRFVSGMLIAVNCALFFLVAYLFGTGEFLYSPELWALVGLSVASASLYRTPAYLIVFYLLVFLPVACCEIVLQVQKFPDKVEQALLAHDFVVERRGVEGFLESRGTPTGATQLDISDIQDKDGNFIPLHMKDGHLVQPFLSKPNAFFLACKERGIWDTLNTDRYGFSNPPGLLDKPTRIAIAGGSDIAGGCVSPVDRIDARLRKDYPDLINLSVPGTGALFRNAAIVEYARFFKPRIMVWFFTENDLLFRTAENRFPYLRKYLQPNFVQNIELYRDQISAAERRRTRISTDKKAWPLVKWAFGDSAQSALRLFETRRMLRSFFSREDDLQSVFGNYFSRIQDSELDEHLDFIERSKREVEKWGGKLVVVMYPSPFTLQASPSDQQIYHAWRERVRKLMRERKLDVLDTSQHMEGIRAASLAYPKSWSPNHLNRKGQEFLALQVERYLRQNFPELH